MADRDCRDDCRGPDQDRPGHAHRLLVHLIVRQENPRHCLRPGVVRTGDCPVTPSNTARGGAIIHPITRSIADAFGSTPELGTSKKIARYLALVNYKTNPITSAMFITATAPNPLIVDLVAKATDSAIKITWGQWALAALLPGLVMLLLMPLVLYFLFPPEIKNTPNAKELSQSELNKLGPVKTSE